ncbi:hypothetical protein KBA39_07260 [Myxococcota bacterium]|nr:hypothetical protein [Myxococcota bacterium]
MTTDELAMLLTQTMKKDLADDRKSWGPFGKYVFNAKSGLVWMSSPSGGNVAYFEPEADGAFLVTAIVSVAIECNGATDEELQEEALDSLENELWPALHAAGYSTEPGEDSWAPEISSLSRFGVKKVNSVAELIAEARFLSRSNLDDTFGMG